jgi:replication-associated recombination protein RarA
MNGPIILRIVREQLADTIFSFRAPDPATLDISPWVAMSLLQKAIRRGENEMAQRAAATLLLIAPDRLWRRVGAAAFEEIGVADLHTVSMVTAALAGKRYRATLGGEFNIPSQRLVRIRLKLASKLLTNFRSESRDIVR